MGITINHYQYNGPVTVPIYYNCIRGPPCSQIFSDVSEKSFFCWQLTYLFKEAHSVSLNCQVSTRYDMIYNRLANGNEIRYPKYLYQSSVICKKWFQIKSLQGWSSGVFWFQQLWVVPRVSLCKVKDVFHRLDVNFGWFSPPSRSPFTVSI